MNFRLATATDKHLPYYSHSIMEAILTCPKWGLIRYKDRKYFKAQYRALALEAGSAMHEVFSALRLWQLLRLQNKPEHFRYHAARLYGQDRFEACFWEKPDPRDEAMTFCFEILNSGEYYDDPSDKIRTMANMEDTTVRYVDEMMAVMDRNHIWVADDRDATAPVGIEIPFDMVVDDAIRYIGTIDAICFHTGSNALRNEENKTANRLDEAWRESFRVKFQPNGYNVAASLITGQQIDRTKIIGIKIKQTRSVEDFTQFVEERDHEKIEDWYKTLWYTHKLTEEYSGRSLEAPMFTHSCNRYFRPCGLIDLCSGSREDQRLIYDSMETTPLTPSERSIILGEKAL
jgi:hypothetical protein